jgi:hypothetical protein
MKLPLTGGCLCGAIRYEITAEPVRMINCHCRTCQKASGAAYLALLFVPDRAISISGSYMEYPTIADSGNTVYRAFCPKCGTALFGRNSTFTRLRPVAAATLDHNRVYSPQKDMLAANAQPWDVMDPDLPKCNGNFW